MNRATTMTSETEHRAKVLAEVDTERTRQDAKWGQQDHPFVRVGLRYLCMSGAEGARYRCDKRFSEKKGSYADILLEEVYEAIDADSEADARAELVQVAAVAVQAIQAIDRRQGGAK